MIMQLISRSPYAQPCPKHRAGSRHRNQGNQEGVYFFLDFSNIAINASQLAANNGDGYLAFESVRLCGENLRHFVQRTRCWRWGYGAAGLTDQKSSIKSRFQQVGIRFDICERGQISGKEQNVDQRIQLEMYRLLAPGVEKGTVALATGDGNGFADNQGFVEVISTLHSHGFAIEVFSWRHSLSSVLRDWAIENGRLIVLDDYYMDLTFIEGRRQATSLNQLSRKMIRNGLV